MPLQHTSSKCPYCPHGRWQITRDPASPYEFPYACDRCTARGVISWAHTATPPEFSGSTDQQFSLFDQEQTS